MLNISFGKRCSHYCPAPTSAVSFAPPSPPLAGQAHLRLFRRNSTDPPPWWGDHWPPPDDGANRRHQPHNPLTPQEEKVYLFLTALGCLPFLLLLLVIILTHSPLVAN